MSINCILTTYVNQLLKTGVYDKLGGGSFSGKIPSCKGVIAFGRTLRECEDGLHSTLEDWILVGLKLGHPLPIIHETGWNFEPGETLDRDRPT